MQADGGEVKLSAGEDGKIVEVLPKRFGLVGSDILIPRNCHESMLEYPLQAALGGDRLKPGLPRSERVVGFPCSRSSWRDLGPGVLRSCPGRRGRRPSKKLQPALTGEFFQAAQGSPAQVKDLVRPGHFHPGSVAGRMFERGHPV